MNIDIIDNDCMDQLFISLIGARCEYVAAGKDVDLYDIFLRFSLASRDAPGATCGDCQGNGVQRKPLGVVPNSALTSLRNAVPSW